MGQETRTRNLEHAAARSRYLRRGVLRGAGMATGVALGATLLGCSRSGSTKSAPGPQSGAGAGSPQSGGTFTVRAPDNPPTLDPQRNTTTLTADVSGTVYSRLFWFKIGVDPQVAINHDLENDLAVSAESPDAQTWTIKMRTDAKFHDIAPVNGHAVEPEDIKATFTRAMDPKNPSRGSLNMIDPDKIEMPSKDTVVFKLNYPYAPFAEILAIPDYSEIFPREALAGAYDPAKQPIGSGPFTFEHFTPDVETVFKKNPGYYVKGLPYVDSLRWPIIPDDGQARAQFMAGHLDMLQQVATTDVDAFKRDAPKAQAITATNGGGSVLYFQLTDNSPFADIRLRRAVSMAIDRDTICAAVYNNQGCDPHFSVKTTMGKWSLRLDQLDASVQHYYKFNLPEAKQLVQQAGGESLNLKFAVPTGGGFGRPESVKTAQAVYNMLAALPWKVTLLPIDFNKDFVGGGHGYFYGNFPVDNILWGGLAIFSTADQYLFRYYDSKSTANQEKLNDPTLDAMIEKGRKTVDVEARRQVYLGVQKYIADKMYSVGGMPAGNTTRFLQPWVKNYQYATEDGVDGHSWARLWLAK